MPIKSACRRRPSKPRKGWLVIYHGVRQTAAGSLYRLGLALFDLETPERCLKRGDEWVFGPEEPYELQGGCGQRRLSVRLHHWPPMATPSTCTMARPIRALPWPPAVCALCLSGLNSTDKGRKTKKDAIEKLRIKLSKSKEDTENYCRSLTIGLNHDILIKRRKNHEQKSEQ